jgi:hypothetical protein
MTLARCHKRRALREVLAATGVFLFREAIVNERVAKQAERGIRVAMA